MKRIAFVLFWAFTIAACKQESNRCHSCVNTFYDSSHKFVSQDTSIYCNMSDEEIRRFDIANSDVGPIQTVDTNTGKLYNLGYSDVDCD